jgi:hypothetical protein
LRYFNPQTTTSLFIRYYFAQASVKYFNVMNTMMSKAAAILCPVKAMIHVNQAGIVVSLILQAEEKMIAE